MPTSGRMSSALSSTSMAMRANCSRDSSPRAAATSLVRTHAFRTGPMTSIPTLSVFRLGTSFVALRTAR